MKTQIMLAACVVLSGLASCRKSEQVSPAMPKVQSMEHASSTADEPRNPSNTVYDDFHMQKSQKPGQELRSNSENK